MYSYNAYNSYGYRLKHYFASGLSKIIDLGNFNQIDYPKYMTNVPNGVVYSDIVNFDANELKKDFETVGKDIGKALDSYGREYPM